MQLFFFYTVRGNIISFFQKFVALSANCLARSIQLFQFTLSDQSFKGTGQDRKAVWVD